MDMPSIFYILLGAMSAIFVSERGFQEYVIRRNNILLKTVVNNLIISERIRMNIYGQDESEQPSTVNSQPPHEINDKSPGVTIHPKNNCLPDGDGSDLVKLKSVERNGGHDISGLVTVHADDSFHGDVEDISGRTLETGSVSTSGSDSENKSSIETQ